MPSLGLQASLLASFCFVMTHGLPGTAMAESNGTIPGLLLILACFAAFEYCGKRGMWRALRFLMLAALVCSVAKFGFYSGVGLVGGMGYLTGVANVPGVSAADVDGLHQTNSLGLPFFVTGGTQNSLKGKLDRFYGKGKFDYDEELVKNVKASYPLCRELLGYLSFNPVISVAKNIWNITDPAHGTLGAGNRSSAFLGTRTHHHGARGAAFDAEHYEEAGIVDRLITDIKALSGFDDYQQQVEFLLLACSMYMVHGSGDAHAKILSAAPLNARCAYAYYNAKVRAKQLTSSKGEVVEFLDERGRTITDKVVRAFRKRTAGGQKVKFLAFAQTGAMELPPGHPDFHKRCVPRVNATVAEADGETLRITGGNTGRFANHAIHAWYLLVLMLHLGLGLPTDADALKRERWWWGNNFSMDLRGHLFGNKAETAADAASSSSASSASSSSSSGEESSDDEDEDDRYAVWMGCTIFYIFLTDELYDALSQKLLGPNYSLYLNDVAVAELIVQAMNDGACEKVGDVEFLDSYLESKTGNDEGKGGFHCPQTWA